VVTLRNALTPRPRYMRAMPAMSGFGFWGSGPRSQFSSHAIHTGEAQLTSDQAIEGLPWTPIHFAGQSSLLDFGFDTDTEARMG